MSFWNLSDNSTIETTGNFEMGGNIPLIPKDTEVLALIEEATIKDGFNDGPQEIKLRWDVLKPEELKGRKVSQTLRVYDLDAAKADKAKRMLANIDVNAGGKLMASGQAPNQENLLGCLGMKPMILKIGVYDMPKEDGTRSIGNWVQSVASKDSVPQPVQQVSQGISNDEIDNNIPF